MFGLPMPPHVSVFIKTDPGGLVITLPETENGPVHFLKCTGPFLFLFYPSGSSSACFILHIPESEYMRSI